MFALHPQLAKDCIHVCDLQLSTVLLMNDSQYPWLIQVPRVANVKESIDLSADEQLLMWQESTLLCHALRDTFKPDKLNVAALGNMVPQLHIHHIARFTTDPAWPKPVWGQCEAVPYTEQDLQRILKLIRIKLQQ